MANHTCPSYPCLICYDAMTVEFQRQGKLPRPGPFLSLCSSCTILFERVQLLEDFLCTAAPTAWATGKYMEDAYEWEKQAMNLLQWCYELTEQRTFKKRKRK